MPIQDDYQASSEGKGVRHWEIPYGRCTVNPPIPTEPMMVTGLPLGSQLTGTTLTVDPLAGAAGLAVVDFTPTMVYYHDVRTVITYNVGAENAWRVLNIGDVVYYDNSGTMPAGVRLSTSPLNAAVAANPVFGWIVPTDPTDMALYAAGLKVAGAAGNTWRCGVMQKGGGA
jgi:hypothetical protein